MDRLTRLASTNDSNAATGTARDFTLRRGDHVYRLRGDARPEQDLLRELRRIARPNAQQRRAA